MDPLSLDVTFRYLKRCYAELSRLLRREPWWAEFWSALTAIAWGGLSSLTDSWPSMTVLLRLEDERFWHSAGIGLGVVQMMVLISDHRWLRWAGAVALCWFWAVLTLGVWAAVPGAPAVAVYAGWCAINATSICRLPLWVGHD